MSPAETPHPQDIATVVQELTRRVTRLEAEAENVEGGPLWVLDGLRRRPTGNGGDVLFAGVVDTPSGRVEWQAQHPVDRLMAEDWSELARTVGALSHPVRLGLARAILSGAETVGDLQDIAGMGTTGQLYHHLRELQTAGWVRQERRNCYRVPADRVLPLLVIVAAAGGLGPGRGDEPD